MAAQKFVSDIAADAFHYAKIRGSGGPSGAAAAASGSGGPAATGSGSTGAGTGGSGRAKTTLTMEDLNLALSDHGVNAKKPDYCEFQLFSFWDPFLVSFRMDLAELAT